MNVLDITPGYQAPAGVQVGELVEMEVRVEIPEGFMRDATIQVTLPEGMSLEEITNYEHPDDMYFSAGSSTQVYNAITVEALGQGEENEGRVITMYTGDIDNGSSDNDEAEYLTLGFTATVLNSEVNQNGYLLSTLGTIEYLSPINGSYTTEYDNANLELREPELDVSIEFFEPELLPGGQTFVTITIEHAESSLGHAYNVDIVNDLPLGLQFVNGSFLSECEELLTAPPTNSFGSITCEWDSIPLGVTCELVYSVQVVNGYPPCTEAVNDIELRYTSGFEAHYDTLTYGPVNSLGVRRTGDPTDIGGDLNDHLSIDSSVLDVVSGTLNQPIIVGNDEFCAGAELNIQIPEYAGTFVEYHWEGPGVPDGYNSNQLILPNPVPDDSGEYTVYIQVGQCLSPISDPFQVNVLENPSVVFEDVNVPCISGVDDLILEADVSGGVGPYDFVWSGPNFLSSDSLAVIENASEDNTGVYSLIVTDSQGCSSVEQMAQVSISTAPPTPEIENGVELCEGLNFQLDCNVYPGAEGYHWMTPNGEVITDTPFLTVSGADPLASGEYTVFVQFEECATDPSFSVEAIVHPTPELPEIIANSIELCSGEDLVLTTDAEGDLFTWSGPDGYEFSGSTANPPFIVDIDLLEAGTYELTVTDGICSSETAEIDIIVNPTPNAPGLASNSPLCVGDLLLLTTSSNASAYEWTLPDNSTETTSSGSLTIQETTVTDAGDYLLSVFDGNCWSEPSPIENVQVDVIPSEQAYAGANVVACQDEAVLVQASNDETLTGFWESPGQTLQLASPNNQTTAVTGAQQGETYNLTWSLYTDGCGVYSVDQVTIYAPVDPIANDDVFEMVEGESEDVFVIENDVPGPVEYTIEIVDFPDYGTAQVAENILIEYRPDVNYDGPDEIIYEMCLNDCPTMCDTAIVRIMVFPYLAIPDIITPNNDGANDMLVIEGIERFPDNEIYIYNRWGRKVYSTENYKNDWDATFQGKPLPDGTYYYVFNNRATGENLGTGYITVHQ
ncbi:MAG: gliding motility-associated C-terminal domain-containing protein [Flavobacteriales bacterium]|nr:gliding motility-associated C-terminal domain-containing protein [Flavobacteriales bacterium]